MGAPTIPMTSPRIQVAVAAVRPRSWPVQAPHWISAPTPREAFVDLHPNSIEKKISLMAEHFHAQVATRIKGKAKAMIVTRSRLHAVRYALTLRKYLAEKRYPYKALVAFSGTVRDGGVDYTEPNLNGVPEAKCSARQS